MSSNDAPTPTKMDENASVSERFVHAIALVDTSPGDAVVHLQELQKQIAALSLFSSNEGIEDVSTKSLPLLALEFHLAKAHLNCRTTKSSDRKTHVLQSIDLFSSFLQRMEELELLSNEQAKDFHDLMDMTNLEDEDQRSAVARTQGQQREAKIARFRAKQQTQKEVERLKSLQQRRGRLGETLSPQDEMDGYDEESLERQVAIKTLGVHAAEALDEWFQAQREIPMMEMAIQMEERRSAEDRHTGVTNRNEEEDKRRPLSGKPLQVTHVTQDAVTGQLKMQKEEIRSKVFQPGWNQPTMTLQELGEMEMKQAMEREARQKVAEAEKKDAPRRYDQLVKDGLEDNADLVDASAQLDRDWDAFKDENPRGCGNKMGDRGDRNF